MLNFFKNHAILAAIIGAIGAIVAGLIPFVCASYKGTLVLITNPENATIRIIDSNNQSLPYTPGMKIMYGSYQVTVSADYYLDETRWIDIVANKNSKEKFILKCKNPIYRKQIDPKCGVKRYNKGKGVECGVEKYNESRGEVCGVERYKAKASPACNPRLYNLRRAQECGPQAYHSCRTGACGWESKGFIKKYKALKCEHPNCGVRLWKTCRHPNFGIELYEVCRDPSHGAEIYKKCRDPKFGVESYKTCENKVFGVAEYNECRHSDFGLERCGQ